MAEQPYSAPLSKWAEDALRRLPADLRSPAARMLLRDASPLDETAWRAWIVRGCVRDEAGVLRLIVEDADGQQHRVMATEAPDWVPARVIGNAPEVTP